MRHLYKKINLEDYRSRIDGHIDVCNAEDMITYNVNGHNYGLFPNDVQINGKIVSYPTLKHFNAFYVFYDDLLRGKTCHKLEDLDYTYSSAVDYYNHEGSKLNSRAYYEALDERYNEYNAILPKFQVYESIKSANSVKEAEINIPISITNSIENLGEMSIFSEEWEGGVVYSKDTVLHDYDENGLILTEEGGSKLNEYYEFEYDDNIAQYMPWLFEKKDETTPIDYSWVRKEFASGTTLKGEDITAFTYNYDDDLILNPSDNYDKMCRKIDPYSTNIFYIHGRIYPSEMRQFVKFNSNDYLVYHEGKLNYILINKKKVYGKIDNERFIFKINVGCETVSESLTVEEKLYGIIGKNICPVDDDNNITINDIGYPLLNAYDVDGYMVFGKINSNQLLPEYFPVCGDYSATGDNKKCHRISNNILQLFYPYKISSFGQISGVTESKLSMFNKGTTLVDDMGNHLQGRLMKDDNGNLIVPNKSNCKDYVMDLLFELGSVAPNLQPLLDSQGNQIKEGYTNPIVDYWWGSIITDMEFYFKDSFGNKIESISGYTSDDYPIKINYENDDWEGLKSYASKMETMYEDLKASYSNETDYSAQFIQEHGSALDTIICDIKYVIGCTIGREQKYDTDDTLSVKYFIGSLSDADCKCNFFGITYTETIKLVKSNIQYYLSDTDFIDLGYYEIQYDVVEHPLYDYNTTILTNMAKFSTECNLYNSDLKCRFSGNTQVAKDNDFTILPVFREEYRIGSSSLENVEGDIYINRGNAQSFDNHLKLMEVKTLEALEQYGNGHFTIKNNKE